MERNCPKTVHIWERSYEDTDTCYIPMALTGSSAWKEMIKTKPMFASKPLFLVTNLPFGLPLFFIKKYSTGLNEAFSSFEH